MSHTERTQRAPLMNLQSQNNRQLSSYSSTTSMVGQRDDKENTTEIMVRSHTFDGTYHSTKSKVISDKPRVKRSWDATAHDQCRLQKHSIIDEDASHITLALIPETLRKTGDSIRNNDEIRKQTDEKHEHTACLERPCVNTFYDAFTIALSLADFITDILLLHQWYQQNRLLPFCLSSGILFIAHLSYLFAFFGRFEHSDWTMTRRMCTLIWLFPFTPVLSIVMHLGSDESSIVSRLLRRMHFNVNNTDVRGDSKTKLEQFLKIKAHKHLGFMLEAFLEAFPQSVLQMTVVVYYDEKRHWLIVTSIILSLISVCSKSAVFARAPDFRSFLFKCLSFSTDFILVFAIVAWVFFNPKTQGISDIGRLFIAKVAIVTIPMILIPIFIGYLFLLVFLFICIVSRDFSVFRIRWLETIGLLFGSMLSVFVLIPVSEVSVFSLFAFYFGAAFNRFHLYTDFGIFWRGVFKFVGRSESWSDARLRVILVIETVFLINEGSHIDNDNDDYVDSHSIDPSLKRYLRSQESSDYRNVKWNDLRNESNAENTGIIGYIASFYGHFWNDVRSEISIPRRWRTNRSICQGMIGVYLMSFSYLFQYLIVPLHILSRLVNICFVWIAMCSVHWTQQDLLQIGMAGLLGCMQIAWLVSFFYMMSLQYCLWHIYPGHRKIFIKIRSEEHSRMMVQFLKDVYLSFRPTDQKARTIGLIRQYTELSIPSSLSDSHSME